MNMHSIPLSHIPVYVHVNTLMLMLMLRRVYVRIQMHAHKLARNQTRNQTNKD